MSIFDARFLDDLSKRLADSMPERLRSLGREAQSNFREVLQNQLARLDLVGRQEFDVQAALLARTQAQLAALEQRLEQMEAKT